MLPIEGTHIKIVAEWWANTLMDFLNKSEEGRHKPCSYIKIKGKKKKLYFETRIAKYKSIFLSECKNNKYKKISQKKKEQIWLKIERFLNEKNNLIGNKYIFEDWILEFRNDDSLFKVLVEPICKVFVGIYTEFTKEYAHSLLGKLNIRCCPYCNRNYTFAVEKNEDNDFTTRPEFDHFYNKSQTPILAVCFYNLIPSCPTCNHGKGTKDVAVNPYFDDFKAKFIIVKPKSGNDENDVAAQVQENAMNALPKKLDLNKIFSISNEDDFDVDFDNPDANETQNIDTLGLSHLYNQHKDYVMEIVEKAAAYNKLARTEIVDSFQGIFHSEADIYNLIFGKYLSDAEQSKRPLSKLTADILDQLEIRQDHTNTSLSSNHRQIIDLQSSALS